MLFVLVTIRLDTFKKYVQKNSPLYYPYLISNIGGAYMFLTTQKNLYLSDFKKNLSQESV